jgi:two-component system CheB/CheR fusion protein
MADEKKTAATGKPRHQETKQKKNLAVAGVVGIGSSAGGLEALTQFFTAMSADSGLAFILVSHLDPTHSSMLPELIQKKTKMPVHQISDNMPLAANRIYVIPPDKELAILHGRLQLMGRKQAGSLHRPIDAFFRSLAEDQGSKAIGIILSGTGTDGTLGIKAIKAHTGLIIVQDKDSARFDGMPTNAAATGLADHILPPEKMPEQLLHFLDHQSKVEQAMEHIEEDKINRALQKIFVLIRSVTGHDFSQYKKNTICRRIERRMYVHQIDTIDGYVDYLQESEREVFILFKELLIGVTSFFRDSETFRSLKEKYLPNLLQKKPNGYDFRIWVPGCSSGEEVYSLAIVVKECQETLGCNINVQLFGTDLDKEAIDTARAAIYPDSISLDVSPERLEKFFNKVNGHYQIKKNIRAMAVFAEQNVIKDPPFTKLDMLSCRNLLIYFGPELQEKLLPTFHYSLKQGGLLLLGTSENIGRATDRFTLLDKKWKIFERRSNHDSSTSLINLPTLQPVDRIPIDDNIITAKTSKDVNTIRLLKAILSQSDLPVCVVVDDKADLIYAHGRTGRFLEPAEGEATSNILHMARPGLKAGLTHAIHKMSAERAEIQIKNLRVKNNGDSQDINLIVRPLPDIQSGYRGLMLIIFDETLNEKEKKVTPRPKVYVSDKNQNTKRLEEELRYTRENLQRTIEELETSNEELKSANEELQSANEELQSTNEELETSKEELQSLNEEASTVNAELQGRIDELVSANDDIKNLLDSTDIATIFLDIDLNIRRFTPLVASFFHLTPSDVGRSIEHFATTLKDVDIKKHATQVLRNLEKYEAVVVDNRGEQYRMRVRPFRTVSNVIEGVVVTFENVTEFQKMVDALAESDASWQELVTHTPVGIFVLTGENFSYVNPTGCEILGASSPEQLLGTSIVDRLHEESRKRWLEQLKDIKNERTNLPASKEKYLRLDGSTIQCDVSIAPLVYKGKQSAVIYAGVLSKEASS